MASLLQCQRAVIDAVADGSRAADASALDAVVAQLRDRPGEASPRVAALSAGRYR